MLLIYLSQFLPLSHLPHQLQRGDPSVRALAIFAQLVGRQRQPENLSEQFLRLFIRKEQIVPVDKRERIL